MTNRADLRDTILRELLNNTDTWTDETLNVWISDAVRDYSLYFPTEATQAIACVTGTRVYSLTTYPVRDVVRVEYPFAESPPRYLNRRPETSDNFEDLPVYDLRGDPPKSLVIGESPTTGEAINLTYLRDHVIPTDDIKELTVPDRHLEAIKLFVQWMAIRNLEMDEARDPNLNSILLSMLGLNSGRAERLYRGKIREYYEAETRGGYAGPWVMDSSDRVY